MYKYNIHQKTFLHRESYLANKAKYISLNLHICSDFYHILNLCVCICFSIQLHELIDVLHSMHITKMYTAYYLQSTETERFLHISYIQLCVECFIFLYICQRTKTNTKLYSAENSNKAYARVSNASEKLKTTNGIRNGQNPIEHRCYLLCFPIPQALRE